VKEIAVQVVREHREDLVRRVRWLTGIVTGLLALLAAGYWSLQIIQGSYYRELAENNRLRKLPISAPRGLIFDRNGRLLVENLPSYTLKIDRSRTADLERSLDFAASVLSRPRSELDDLLERFRAVPVFKPVLVAENLSLSEVARIGAHKLEYPEFEVEVQHQRLYRQRDQTAHVVGYIGEVSQTEVDRSNGTYTTGDLVGKKGIEQTYDAALRGRDGDRVIVVDSRGQLLQEYGNHLSVPGRNLSTTIDLDLQQEAAHALDGPEKVGAIVALDPRNGEVLALVSSPSFNSNSFAHHMLESEWRSIVDAPFNPLQDRALQNAYSPGSTFKMIMATAGLSEGLVDENFKVFCPGSATFYGHTHRCWRPEGHGWVNIHDAIKGSCDVFFYHLGVRLGIERIARYARLFGFGSPTGVDIHGEKIGLVPDNAWSVAFRHSPWYPGETVSVSIGQGPILLTPLQMASITAVVANGGWRVTPHLVRDASFTPAVHLPIDEKILAIVRRGMWSVVNDPGGSAFGYATVPGADIAGKTGSVQVIAQHERKLHLPFNLRDHGWFTSFAPADHPQIVLSIFLEHGGSGHNAAVVAKGIYQKYFSTHPLSPAVHDPARTAQLSMHAGPAISSRFTPPVPATTADEDDGRDH
jgi:penicillin-binding protein 2